MRLKIKKMTLKTNISQILQFQTDDNSMFWREMLFGQYKELDKAQGLYADWESRKKYLEFEFTQMYKKYSDDMDARVCEFAKYWNEKESEIVLAFESVFGAGLDKKYNDITAEVSLNSICPRWLAKRWFSVFFKSDKEWFLSTALHEIIHFIWFDVWQNHFKDNPDEYDSPHLKWLLSEMVIDTIVKNTEIGKLFSKQDREKPAYNYFYEMTVNGKPILDSLTDFYKISDGITDFMERAYKFVLDNESEIREQVK